MRSPNHDPTQGLFRDVARFQLKLLLEAARDLVLIPLSLAAACWDLALSSRQTPRFFRRVIDLGRRSDDYIDLWGKDDAGKPVENVDAVMARVERLLRDPRSGPRQARALRRWVEISVARQRRHAGNASPAPSSPPPPPPPPSAPPPSAADEP